MNSGFSEAKVTKFLSLNVGGILVDNAVFRLPISRSVPEVFVIRVKSSPKSRRLVRPQILRVKISAVKR